MATKEALDNFGGPVKRIKLRHLHCSSCATEVVQLVAVAMGGIWEVFPELEMGAAHLCKGRAQRSVSKCLIADRYLLINCVYEGQQIQPK